MIRFQAFYPKMAQSNYSDFRWEISQQLCISQGNISALLTDFHGEKINAVNYFPISLMYFQGKNNTWVKQFIYLEVPDNNHNRVVYCILFT